MSAKPRSFSWLILFFSIPAVLLAAELPGAHRQFKEGGRENLSFPEKNRSTDQPAKVRIAKSYGQLPMYFIENRGQVDKQVKYYARGKEHSMFFTREGLVLTLARPVETCLSEGDQGQESEAGEWTPPNSENLFQDFGHKLQELLTPSLASSPGDALSQEITRGDPRKPVPDKGERLPRLRPGDQPPPVTASVVRMQPVGMRKQVKIRPIERQECKVNYFIGNDPKKWRTDIPTFAGVVYQEAYKGIDLKFYGNGQQMEYDVVVNPGADPGQVRFAYEGVKDLKVTPEGHLAMTLPDGGELLQKKPYVYQEIAGARVAREGRFQLKDDAAQLVLGFEVAAYDPRYPLVIDPVLVYSTYLGGSNADYGYAIAADSEGSVYATGMTVSNNFPLVNPIRSVGGWRSAFVTKLNPAGTGLMFSTYFGGTGWEEGFGIAVDNNQNIYLTGVTRSEDFPLHNAVDTLKNGLGDAFVTKFNSTGSQLIYSTYLGGDDNGTYPDEGRAIAVDQAGNTYVTGCTFSSSSFPTKNPIQAVAGGVGYGVADAFVAKLGPNGGLIYSTYLGGTGDDRGNGISVDRYGNACVAGETSSAYPSFPLKNAYQSTHALGKDAFISKINSDGSDYIYSTYLGGSSTDRAFAIATDNNGNAYVTGETDSGNFPTKNPFKGKAPGFDVFITKFNPDGSDLVYSTFYGGGTIYVGSEHGFGIAVDNYGSAWVTGRTQSAENFPLVKALQTVKANSWDAFVAKVDPSGYFLQFSTYLGGNGDDYARGIAVDLVGNAYVTGYTYSTNFPTKNSFQASNRGAPDAFVVKISDRVSPYFTFSPVSSPQQVGVPLNVNITAWKEDGTVDTGFQGCATLSCQVPIDRSLIIFSNGVWTGTVTLTGGGTNLVLKAISGGYFGASNSFSTEGAANLRGGFSGRVTDNRSANPQPLANAEVTLQGQTKYTTYTNEQGWYNFSGVPAGAYSLWATFKERQSSCQLIFVHDKMLLNTNLIVPIASSRDKIPVVLVAGYTGSTRKTTGLNVPRLKDTECTREELKLFDVLGVVGWGDLKNILEQKEIKVVDCPWDWRVPIKGAMEKFLKPAIEEAQGGDPNKKVNIIAHSMGGLLVRHYIQSFPPEGLTKLPIANFIMVGTPNEGSSNIYYIWEGGDPKTLDDLTESPFGQWQNFATLIMTWLMKDTNWLWLDDDWKSLPNDFSLVAKNLIYTRTFVTLYLPTARQLLPTYPFLNDGTSLPKKLDANELLLLLNGNEGIGANRFLMGPPGNSQGRVPTKVFYSQSHPTIGNIQVKQVDSFWSNYDGLYPDGQPINYPIKELGDGTVLLSSSTLPVREGWAEGLDEDELLAGKHLALVKTYAQKIAQFLYPDAMPLQSTAMGTAAEVSPTFSISFNGWLEPYITDPLGRTAGTNPITGAAEHSIPEVSIETEANQGGITIDNPLDGIYSITLKGRYSGAYNLTLSYLENGMSPFLRDVSGYSGTDPINLAVHVAAGEVERIIVISPSGTPSNLLANAVNQSGLMTSLTWTASSDPNVTSYKIYAKGVNESTFTLLGTTNGTTFLTGDPWAADGSTTPRVYVVVAVKQDGTESFFSNAALNNDRDHDGLTDVDELKYGTNPDKADTDGDGFTDGQEYLGSSNPLDPNSRPPTKGKGLAAILQLLLFD